MNCQQCRENLVAYAEGLLDSMQRSQVELHLADCEPCRAEAEATRRLFDRLVRTGRAAPSVRWDFRLTDQLISERHSRQRRRIMTRIARISVAAAVLAIAVFGVLHLSGGSNGAAALAAAVEYLNQAKTVTWTWLVYQNLSTRDRKATWVQVDTIKEMYKAPGLTRREDLDANGQVKYITIEDLANGIELRMDVAKKTAQLIYLGEPLEKDRLNVSDWIASMSQWLSRKDGQWIMGEPKPLGEREIDGRQAIGYRVSRKNPDIGLPSRPPHWSADLWIDAQTKKLILVNNPGLDVYDPDEDVARGNPPGNKEYLRRSMGSVIRDIVHDQELDDSLFGLEPPKEYKVTTIRVPEVTEKDLVEWLGICAACNGGVFQGDKQPLAEGALHRILKKFNTHQKLSPAEQKLLDYSGGYPPAHGWRGIERFAEKTAGRSWHYAGKGVKLGDKTRAVCWYQPESSKTYRVVYGDLSVKDVSPEDLPRNAEPR
jgi:hypothetical protein